MDMENNFLKVAKQAAKEAGKIIKKSLGKFGKKSIKEDDKSNFVTKVDIAAEEIIVQILSENFPTHNILGEEKVNKNNGSEYTWVIDPLDGTFSYTRALPHFCVSIGLLKENKPVLGVILHVSTDNLFWAQVGQGTYLNDQLINVSKINSLEEGALYLDFGHKGKRQPKFELYIRPLMAKVGRIYSLGSTALGLVWVGGGMLDASVVQAWLWDFVAGTVIVREAGGEVTDFDGREPDWSKERLNIVASNGLIHDQILEALK